DATLVLGDLAHRRAEPDGGTEPRLDRLRDRLRAALDAVLLVTAFDRHEPREPAVRMEEVERVQERQLGGVDAEEAGEDRRERRARESERIVVELVVDPGRERPAVPLASLRRVPRRV